MELWIARDLNDDLCLYSCKPNLVYDTSSFNSNSDDEYLVLNPKLFPEVIFENSPKKVKIELIED